MSNDPHPDPVSDPVSGMPAGEQPLSQQPPSPQPSAPQPQQAAAATPQQYPENPPHQSAQQTPESPPQSPAQQYPPQHAPEYVSPPYPQQQYPPAYPAQPYAAQGPFVPGPAQGPFVPGQAPQGPFVPGQVPTGPVAQAPYPQAPYPQAPYPQASYPQGAYPQAPYLQGGAAQQSPYPQQPPYPPAGFPTMPGQPAQKPRGKGVLILGITAGVVALTVVATLLLQRPGVPQVVAPLPSGTATGAVQTETAESAVQGYLEALAQGDAVTALAYAATPPSDTSMLSNEVLAVGLATAPLSDIQVSPGSGGSSSDTIEASYRLGDRTVSASFPVARVNSAWRLERPLAKVTLSSMQPDLLPLRLNGAAITTEALEVFPGLYSVTSGDPRYSVSDGVFLAQSPDDRPDTYSMKVALSAEGRTLVRAAAQKKLTSCVKQRSLNPAGCGFGTRLPAGNKAKTSTIRWKITKNSGAMKKIKPTVDGNDPTLVRAAVDVQLRVNFASTNGRSWYGNSGVYSVRADLSGSGEEVTLG